MLDTDEARLTQIIQFPPLALATDSHVNHDTVIQAARQVLAVYQYAALRGLTAEEWMILRHRLFQAGRKVALARARHSDFDKLVKRWRKFGYPISSDLSLLVDLAAAIHESSGHAQPQV